MRGDHPLFELGCTLRVPNTEEELTVHCDIYEERGFPALANYLRCFPVEGPGPLIVCGDLTNVYGVLAGRGGAGATHFRRLAAIRDAAVDELHLVAKDATEGPVRVMHRSVKRPVTTSSIVQARMHELEGVAMATRMALTLFLPSDPRESDYRPFIVVRKSIPHRYWWNAPFGDPADVTALGTMYPYHKHGLWPSQQSSIRYEHDMWSHRTYGERLQALASQKEHELHD